MINLIVFISLNIIIILIKMFNLIEDLRQILIISYFK
jgi:hypothetical protein